MNEDHSKVDLATNVEPELNEINKIESFLYYRSLSFCFIDFSRSIQPFRRLSTHFI